MQNVLVIIVNYRSARLTISCLRSLAPARGNIDQLRVQVVENDSGDAAELTAAINTEEFRDWVVLTVAPRNGGFAYGNNLALREALDSASCPEFFFLLNPDAEVRELALERLLAFMTDRTDVGVVGPRIENADGSDWNWAFRFPSIWSELDTALRLGPVSRLLKDYAIVRPVSDKPDQVDWLPGAALLVRRSVFDKVGLFDQAFFLYFEETDFLLHAARAGFECWRVPQACVMHISGQSTGVTSHDAKRNRLPAYWFESRRRYFLKNHGMGYAIAADFARTFGAALFELRRRVVGKQNSEPPFFVRDLIKHSVVFPKNRRNVDGS